MDCVGVVNRLCLRISLIAAGLVLACAAPLTAQGTAQVSVWARSHNRGTLDVYLLCGNRDAQWLGLIGPHEATELNFSSARTRCVQGMNFFLVDRKHNHGYWVGPIFPARDSRIELVIERYAGLSSASLARD
jgi:hypothetical protein